MLVPLLLAKVPPTLVCVAVMTCVPAPLRATDKFACPELNVTGLPLKATALPPFTASVKATVPPVGVVPLWVVSVTVAVMLAVCPEMNIEGTQTAVEVESTKGALMVSE